MLLLWFCSNVVGPPPLVLRVEIIDDLDPMLCGQTTGIPFRPETSLKDAKKEVNQCYASFLRTLQGVYQEEVVRRSV